MKTGRRARAATLAAAVVLLAVVGCDMAAVDETRGCQEQRQADEAKVLVGRWEWPEELPLIGEYAEIHWQARALGDPCSRLPGPTDWEYQGVIVLRPEDARTMAEQFDFVPFASIDPAELTHSHTPTDVRPDLVAFLPAKPQWLHSQTYNETKPSPRRRVAFLDLEHHTLLFMLNDN
ncbi:hypothetical protein O7631_13905 [Micromonospora sp. WMMD967]|uniref:hypothetical protein n=1 Tax=Micromonospora sp. WMMD967 TaxID=3016101 RepID=UPI002417718D|nr:hypothetical protein [Micromonospora sp. WMMD967]MDG4837611.1 hypothetical protein [Micromonospora sp. WMMD967]